jgi:hypothetical protein
MARGTLSTRDGRKEPLAGPPVTSAPRSTRCCQAPRQRKSACIRARVWARSDSRTNTMLQGLSPCGGQPEAPLPGEVSPPVEVPPVVVVVGRRVGEGVHHAVEGDRALRAAPGHHQPVQGRARVEGDVVRHRGEHLGTQHEVDGDGAPREGHPEVVAAVAKLRAVGTEAHGQAAARRLHLRGVDALDVAVPMAVPHEHRHPRKLLAGGRARAAVVDEGEVDQHVEARRVGREVPPLLVALRAAVEERASGEASRRAPRAARGPVIAASRAAAAGAAGWPRAAGSARRPGGGHRGARRGPRGRGPRR